MATPTKENNLLVHMSHQEAAALDYAQGGPTFDQETGLREYSAWSELIENPEIQEIAQEFTKEVKQSGKMGGELDSLYKEGERQTPPFQPAPGDHEEPFASLAAKGTSGDDVLVWLPEEVAIFFAKARGGMSENRETQLLEFGGKGSVMKEGVKVLGTIGGFVAGGPMGAGLGRAAAGMATGQKFGDAAHSGLQWGAISALPGLATSAASAAGWGAPANMWASVPGAEHGLLPSFLTGSGAAAAPAAAGATGAGKSVADAAGKKGLEEAAKSSGFMDSIFGKALPHLGIAGLSYLAQKDHEKQAEENRERHKRELDQEMRKRGFYNEYSPSNFEPRTFERDQNYRAGPGGAYKGPEWREQKLLTGGSAIPSLLLAAGGPTHRGDAMLRGPGKGQDDEIHTQVPAGTYIVDASTNSMVGDGDSEAGSRVFDQFINDIMRKSKSHGGRVEPRGHVPVALSAGEKPIPAHAVRTLGGGSMDKGAKLLEGMIKEIRKDKSRAGSGLPPKAKPLNYYLGRK